MLAMLLAFIRSLFGVTARSAKDAKRLGDQASMRVAAFEQRNISCPFHVEDGESCSFNKKTNSFFCMGCKRSGTMATLRARLDDADVYRDTVK